MIPFNEEDLVLFIGDSITECGRREEADTRGFGNGYMAVCADFLTARYPEKRLRFLNRGVGGDRVVDLAARWEEDVLRHRPDWLSISIGINDVWPSLSDDEDVRRMAIDLPAFEKTYRDIIEQTKAVKADTGLVLMETSVIGERIGDEGNRRLEPYNDCIRRLACDYKARLAPVNRVWRRALQARPDVSWTNDGVHPYENGHMLIATAWLEAIDTLPVDA